MTAPRTLAEEAQADSFLGWWCQRPGYVFHTDPVDGCPGPHVGCYSWPADIVLRLVEENEGLGRERDGWKEGGFIASEEYKRLRERAKSVLWLFDGNSTTEERRAALERLRQALTETPEREG